MNFATWSIRNPIPSILLLRCSRLQAYGACGNFRFKIFPMSTCQWYVLGWRSRALRLVS